MLPVCALWLVAELPLLLAGFTIPLLAAGMSLGICGRLAAASTNKSCNGVFSTRTARPFRIHCTSALRAFSIGWAFTLHSSWAPLSFSARPGKDHLRLAAWIAISFAAVCFGNHFAPRYFLQLLPPLVIVAARGMALSRRALPVFAVLLLIPLVRFGPRYVTLALGRDPNWSDAAMDRDSQRAAAMIQNMAKPGDTLFVWGYRPDLYVYTRRISAACSGTRSPSPAFRPIAI